MKFDLCLVTISSSSFLLASVCFAATMERMENERSASNTESVPSAESLRPREREHVRPALALAVDVNAADLVDQRIDQLADLVRVGAEDRHLLPVLGRDDVVERRLDVLESASRERSGRTAPRDRASCPPSPGTPPPDRRTCRRTVPPPSFMTRAPCSFGVADALGQIRDFVQLGQRRDADALLPRHADLAAWQAPR